MNSWDRLAATYSANDSILAATHVIAPQALVEISGADRLGDINPSNMASFGKVKHEWFEHFAVPDLWDNTFALELRNALERRQWLWLAEIEVCDLQRVQERVGYGLLRPVGAEHDGWVVVGINPCDLVRAWLRGTPEQQRYMKWVTKGTDALRVSRHDLAALRSAGVPLIERPSWLRFLRSPKVIAYLVVLVYSSLRAVPVMFVKEFHGHVWIVWAIDLITAIPYTWGIIAMVAARQRWVRLTGALVALITFVLPYVYFWTHGQSYPWYVNVVIATMVGGAILLELGRWLRDRAVARCLRTPREIA